MHVFAEDRYISMHECVCERKLFKCESDTCVYVGERFFFYVIYNVYVCDNVRDYIHVYFVLSVYIYLPMQIFVSA